MTVHAAVDWCLIHGVPFLPYHSYHTQCTMHTIIHSFTSRGNLAQPTHAGWELTSAFNIHQILCRVAEHTFDATYFKTWNLQYIHAVIQILKRNLMIQINRYPACFYTEYFKNPSLNIESYIKFHFAFLMFKRVSIFTWSWNRFTVYQWHQLNNLKF